MKILFTRWNHVTVPTLAALLILLAALLACGGGSGGQTASSIQTFTPTTGYPGQVVTLTGTGLKGAQQVTFGGIQALTFSASQDTQLTATVPAGAVTGPVKVVAPGGSFQTPGAFTVLALPAAPVVASFQPPSGRAGQTVTLTGSGFTTATAVAFAGVAAASFQLVDDATLTAVVPASAPAGLISVVNPSGTGTSNGDFTILPPVPALAPLTVSSGTPGSALTLTGTGLTGTSQVLFGPSAALFAIVSDTVLNVTVPASTGSTPITVQTPGGTASTGPFTILAPPLAVTGYTPNTGQEGDTVTLTGTSLAQASGVTFGGVPATQFLVSADGTTLTATVPAGAATGTLALVTGAGSAPVTVGPFTVTSPALAATGFSPQTGPAGTTVTVTGTHLELATGASVGGTAATGITPAGDGGSLTFKVPPGTSGGTVALVTAGGPVQVPGGSFSVQPPAPTLTVLDPPQGVPGTEVTLTGTNLGGPAQVLYASQLLPTGRYDLDTDTSIRVRIPDDAQGPGVLTVITAGGQADSAPFTPTPSRAMILPRPLVKVANPFGDAAKPLVNFPDGSRSAIYGLAEPLAPVFHPYNQNLFGGAGSRAGIEYPDYTLALKLPATFYALLPQQLRSQVEALGIAQAQLDILVVSQDYAFDGVTPNDGVYLFRPHYWTDPLAPVSGLYSVAHVLSGAIYQADAGVTLSGLPANTLLAGFGINTHQEIAGAPSQILASGNSEPMGGFDVTRTTGLWSLVVESPRAVATLHLLFNDADQTTLRGLVPGWNTLEDLVDGLAASPLSTGRGVAMLLALARPVVNTVTASAPDGAGNRTLTLSGTGLAEATAVSLDGAPLGGLSVLSDALVKVTLPPGAAGNLTVTTPLGTSDPIATP